MRVKDYWDIGRFSSLSQTLKHYRDCQPVGMKTLTDVINWAV